MPWNLEINIIDVGQGESTLIIAQNTATGQERSLLVDAGLSAYAQTVHTYVAARLDALNMEGLNHILVSHYDDDHSGGVMALLTADNLSKICDIIAEPTADTAELVADAANYNGRANQIAAAAAVACAVVMGAYDDPDGDDYSNLITLVRTATRIALGPMNDANAAAFGISEAEKIMQVQPDVNPSLVKTTIKRRDVASRAGIAAADAIRDNFNVTTSTCSTVFNRLRTTVPEGSRFLTGGLYENTHLIDIGNTTHMPSEYRNVIDGQFIMSGNFRVTAPGIDRTRTAQPNLGSEVLWNTGPTPIAAPATSPALFVVACRKYIWRAPANSVPIASGQPDNDDSIGLILRFNNFFYYTGGDLPWQGENLIATAIRNNGLPNPAGGNFPTTATIACFKCGHHGSDHSTSQIFLNTLQPSGAFISAGDATFGNEHHPTQGVIDRLQAQASVRFFYMTNCRYIRNTVPASQDPPQNQLPVAGNKSRLAGDNADDNLQAGRRRGNIRMMVNQATSQAAAGPGRQYRVRYFEPDSHVDNFRVENTQF